jgi:hypothetical protein
VRAAGAVRVVEGFEIVGVGGLTQTVKRVA